VGGSRKTMFGYPCAFENGQLFTRLFSAGPFVRLGEKDRAELLAIAGAQPRPRPRTPWHKPLEHGKEAEGWVLHAVASLREGHRRHHQQPRCLGLRHRLARQPRRVEDGR